MHGPSSLFWGKIRLNPTTSGGANSVLATFPTITTDPSAYTELAALVERAQGGDRDAFGALVEQFQRTVHAICLRRLGNPSEALELTQEVFLHVMRRIDQLREPERFAGWIRQVAVRMAINRATRRPATPSVQTDILEAAAEHHDDPLDALISRERALRLHEGLARLKSLDRETLVAFYLQGRSLIEMAEEFDAPLGTIKRRLHTARKRLKEELQAVAPESDEWSEFVEPSNDENENLVAAGHNPSRRW